MSRVTIYLPPRLKAAVKAANLPVSAVCQDALRRRLTARERAMATSGQDSQDSQHGAAVETVAP